MGKTIDYKKAMAELKRDRKRACREYLDALDLPRIFAGEPGTHCPMCGSDDVDVEGCGWTCRLCQTEGEFEVQVVVVPSSREEVEEHPGAGQLAAEF